MNITAQAAIDYNALGLATIPVGDDKRPYNGLEWKAYQTRRPNLDEVSRMFNNGHTGIALPCGLGSDNLEVVDVDQKNDLLASLSAEFMETCREFIPDTFKKLVIARTPSKGLHIYYRCNEVGGNLKLARRPTTKDERVTEPNKKHKDLIETRGQGGYAVTAPTPGYEFLQGDFSDLATISPEERDSLFAIARSFDEMQTEVVPEPEPVEYAGNGLSPGQDFNDRGDISNILESHGFRRVGQRGENILYRYRDSKNPTSASYHPAMRCFYVFSTSTPFESDKGYSHTSVYTMLEHAGDFKAAYRALADQGYGEKQRRPVPKAHRSDSPDAQSGQYARTEETLAPIPIPELPTVPRLDLALLPPVIREFVADAAARRSCAPEFVAVSALAGLGSVIGTKVGVCPKQNDKSYFLYANIYALIIADSGSKKTDGIMDGLRFVEEIEREQWAAFEARKPEIDADNVSRKLEIEAIETKLKGIANGKKSKDVGEIVDRESLKKELAELMAIKPETPRRLMIQDATIEKAGILLNENPNGLIAYHDEITPLIDTLRHKEKERDRGFYLKAANGTGTDIVDRVSRDSLLVKNLCLSLIGGAQPARLSSLVETTASNGGDDGLLPRFGATVWPDMPSFCYIDTPPQGEHEARKVFRRLYDFNPASMGFKQLTVEAGSRFFIDLSANAQEFYREWLTGHENEVRANGTNGTDIPAAHISKYAALMPKIAMILQMVDIVCAGAGNEISLKNIELAVEWIEFFKAHARRLYAGSTRPEFKAAKAILDRVRRGDLEPIFTARDVYRKHWRGLAGTKEVSVALDLLVEYQWLRVLTEDTGGKPLTRYVFTDMEYLESSAISAKRSEDDLDQQPNHRKPPGFSFGSWKFSDLPSRPVGEFPRR